MKFKGTNLSKRTVALLAAALVLLGSSGVMGAKAAPNITANNPYDAQLQLNSVAVDLTEQVAGGEVKTVSDGALTLTNDKTLSVGKAYDDVIGVANNGAADEYVRVIVRRYWTDADGKRLDLSPEYIELTADSSWTKVSGINEEYSIYYLTSPLSNDKTDGKNQKTLFTGFRINEAVKTEGKKIMIGKKEYDSDEKAAEAAGAGDVKTYTYTYNGVKFNVEAEAQSVQTHNSAEAIKSLWGVDAASIGITLVD